MLHTAKYSKSFLTRIPEFSINSEWILNERGPKNVVDARAAYAYLVEDEYDINGALTKVATIFLTNKECPFKCLMCDLWKNTLNESVASGDIPHQIKMALENMPQAQHLKLYNSGNFFDKKAIPSADYGAIADLIKGFETVLVEAHPSFIGQPVLDFQKLIEPQLQVAIGLETVHPEVMDHLNKKMSLTDFSKAVKFLNSHGISNRAFILLRPPFLSEEEGVLWATKSIDFAFESGVECCVIIPTRSGNGALDTLSMDGLFEPPNIASLASVLDYGLSLNRGRVFADLWDIEQFATCEACLTRRIARMKLINETQQSQPIIVCKDCRK
jgi:radical SAM enzyme (TIGR01210 family)